MGADAPRRRVIAACAMALLVLGLAAPPMAAASELVDRDTSSAALRVNARGIALVTYKARGTQQHVLYWNGANRTLRFKRRDRSGGWKSKAADWKNFTNSCGSYSGPQLAYVIDACTAPDGTHWALQEWMRGIPNYGGETGPRELRLSHFTGATAYLWIGTDWSWGGRYTHMYGQYVYQGKPVYGNAWKPDGYVLDQLGRNIAIDTYYSDYGPGWRRVNAFLSNAPSGQFCFGFAPKGGSPHTGKSQYEYYRASVVGPGVSPDIMTYFRGQLGAYDKAIDAQANHWQKVLAGGRTSGPCATPN